MSEFACQLNEPEENVAPTDSRLRPDQRLMENGSWDDASQEKIRLEEKQRAARRKKEEDQEQARTEGGSCITLATILMFKLKVLLNKVFEICKYSILYYEIF